MSQVTLPRFYFHFYYDLNIDTRKTSQDIELAQKYIKLPNMAIHFTKYITEDTESIYYADLSDMVNAMPDGTVGSNLSKILFALCRAGINLIIFKDEEFDELKTIKPEYKIVGHNARLDFISNYQINLTMNKRNSMQAFNYPLMVYTLEDLAGNVLTCLFNINNNISANIAADKYLTDTIASNQKLINDYGFTIDGKPLICDLQISFYFHDAPGLVQMDCPQCTGDVITARSQSESDNAIARYAQILLANLRDEVSDYAISHLAAHFTKDYQIGFELELPENSKSKTYWDTYYPPFDSCINLAELIWKAYFRKYANKSGYLKHLPFECDAMAAAMLKLNWNLDFSNAKTTVKPRKVKQHRKDNQAKVMAVNDGVIDVYKSISTPAHRKYFITDNMITYILHRFVDGKYVAVQIDYLKDKYNE